MPVLHPERPGHVLLKPGATLDAPAVEKLRELKVAVLWVRYPALEFLARYNSPRIVQEHAQLTAALSEGFDAVSKRTAAPMDFRAYADAVGGLLRSIVESPDAALFIHEISGRQSPLLAHCANVCFLALLLGLRLEGYLVQQRSGLPTHRARKIESLGLGALLHDLGMLHLPEGVLEKYLRTGKDDDPAIREHVRLGFELVRGKVPPTAAGVVLHHHQRYDGKGYPALARLGREPAPLAGLRIHIFARIVAVADAFDRLRHPPGPAPGGPAAEVRPTAPAVRVLRCLLDQARAGVIDPVVFHALLAVVPAYPPGSEVRLSDGTRAVVTGFDRTDPCRPTVRPLTAPLAALADQAVLGAELDLSRQPRLAIAECDGQATLDANFYPGAIPQPEPRTPRSVTPMRVSA
ncbi:MAG TPA: HD domain-containing phosphohydrolase [Phycisphaerales bacterium]|nr:HD domain-containing phosphohydrolase [Phycisphaerales bacterium]